jgi:hypothetical protein
MLQQGSPQLLPQKGGHPQGSGPQHFDPNPTDKQQQQESKRNESTSNKRNIKNKVLVEEKQLTARGGLSAQYSRTG